MRNLHLILRITVGASLMLAFAAGATIAGDGYTRNVAIVIWNGAEVLDWAGPSEVFESAARFGARGEESAFSVYTVSKTTDSIRSQRFIEVVPQYSIANAPQPDIVVLPGGGTNSVLNDPEFLEWVGRAAREADVGMSVCTGAFVLARSGLLDGKDATTWYGALDRFEESYPETHLRRGSRLVDNGQFVTTAGVSAGIDGALHVVARLLGRYVADQTAQYMEYRWTPEAYLARDYAVLNPSLDERGRTIQQADIAAAEGRWPVAIASYRELVESDPSDTHCWFQLATSYYTSGRYADAASAYVRAARAERLERRAYYNAACSASLDKDIDNALEYLSRAIEAGMTDADWMRGDTDLQNLRGDPRFEALLDGIRAR